MEKAILELANTLDKSTVEDAERMLRSFYRTIEPHQKRNWMNPDRLSWELYAERDRISFYLVVPKRIERLIKSRMLDAYPQINVKSVEEDHVDKFEKPFVAQMDLHKHFMYSTKMTTEDTPLNSILNSMSRLEEDEKILMQISLVPVNNKWQGKAYAKYRDLLFRGKKPNVPKYKLSGGILYGVSGIMWLIETVYGFFIDMGGDKQLKNTPIERQELKATQRKIALPAFNASIRLAVESKDKNIASTRLSELANSFIETDGDNEWRRRKLKTKDSLEAIRERKVEKRTNNIVTTAELSPIVRMPNKNINTPELLRKLLKTLPIPKGLEEGLFIGKGLFNSEEIDLFMDTKYVDDLVHPMTITGAMGAGKTTLILNLMLARALAGYGVILIDTQGDMSLDFISQLPESEWDRVVWLNFGDLQYPVALDLLEFISMGSNNEHEDFIKDWAEDELVALMKKMWGQNFGPQTEYITRHNITAVIETQGTFIEMFRMLLDNDFREQMTNAIQFKAPMSWLFWRQFQDQYSEPQKMRMLMPSINKIGSFVKKRIVRNITSQGAQNYNFRDLMDSGKIVVVTIPKGVLIGDTWKLIGSLIISKIWLASVSRNNIPIEKRFPCFLACDEFEDIITDTFPIMLSQSRKYRLGICVGFQYLDQIKTDDRKVFNAIIGNRPHMVALKVGDKDAGVYADIFKDFYTKEELSVMPNLHGVARLSIGGELTTPFTIKIPWNYFTRDNSARTYSSEAITYVQDRSRKLYAKPKEEVERIVDEKYSAILGSFALSEDDDEEEFSGDLELML